MTTIKLTEQQAKALILVAQGWIESKEDEFRDGSWEEWNDEDSIFVYATMATLHECLPVLHRALPCPFAGTALGDMLKAEREGRTDVKD